MKLAKAMCMALGMFTALPLPWRPWDEDARGLMLACLPVVGAVLGLLWALLALVARALLPLPLAAAVVAALPWLLTGFFHLDGYLDACDALLSWRSAEERLRILKDPHVGAFAAVGLGLLMLFSYAAASCLGGADLRVLALVPVASRCGSALSVLSLKPLAHSEYARTGGSALQRGAVAAMWLVAVAVAALWLGRGAAVVLLAESAAYALAMGWAVHVLKGVSGDLAGFALTLSEAVALVVLALV